MPYRCDHCEEELRVDRDGDFVDRFGSTECAEHDNGHTWEGRRGL